MGLVMTQAKSASLKAYGDYRYGYSYGKRKNHQNHRPQPARSTVIVEKTADTL